MRRNGERHLYLGSIPTKYRKRKTSNNEHGKGLFIQLVYLSRDVRYISYFVILIF